MPLSNREWVETRLEDYFEGFCRKAFRWSPAYKATLRRAFVRKEGKIEYYRCELCSTVVPRRQKQIDHIEPVVDVVAGRDGSWDTYKIRMFVDETLLQLLCKPCHRKKTNKENSERWKTKKQK